MDRFLKEGCLRCVTYFIQLGKMKIPVLSHGPKPKKILNWNHIELMQGLEGPDAEAKVKASW